MYGHPCKKKFLSKERKPDKEVKTEKSVARFLRISYFEVYGSRCCLFPDTEQATEDQRRCAHAGWWNIGHEYIKILTMFLAPTVETLRLPQLLQQLQP